MGCANTTTLFDSDDDGFFFAENTQKVDDTCTSDNAAHSSNFIGYKKKHAAATAATANCGDASAIPETTPHGVAHLQPHALDAIAGQPALTATSKPRQGDVAPNKL